MVRGTTPTYTFEIPFDTNLIASAKVIFSQGEVSVSKRLHDCSLNGSELSVKLTQEDTFKFCKGAVEMIIRVLTLGGDALASDVMYDFVRCCNDDEVLTNEV
jgi:hypothetical protein